MSDILSKVVNDPGDVRADARGGALRAPQVNRFLDYMWDKTVLGSQVRTERIKGETAELTRIAVGERLLRVATEAADDGLNVGAAFGKVSISTTKFRLDWELSSESLEDGLEGEALEDHIVRLMAGQVANDLEDIAINADSSKAGTNLTLGAFDGWAKIAERTAHVVDAGGSSLDRNILSKMIKAMPRKGMQNRAGLKFFAGSNDIQDLLDSEAALALGANQIGTSAADHNAYGVNRMYGQSIEEVPLFSDEFKGTYSGAGASEAKHSQVWLTNPKNIIWAVQREVQVFREFKPKKDSIEYTLYCRVGTAIEDPNQFVVATGVAAK